MTSHTTPLWTVRIIAALASIPLGLAAAAATPMTSTHTDATSNVPTQAELTAANDVLAVGRIVSGAAVLPCESVDALAADTALVRRVGSLEVASVRASWAWDLAERSEVVVIDWCA